MPYLTFHSCSISRNMNRRSLELVSPFFSGNANLDNQMGQCCCFLYTYLFEPPVIRVLMLGLDNSGKKTILARLGNIISYELTLYFQVDTVDYKELYIRSWDIGGCWQPRALWRYFYRYTEGGNIVWLYITHCLFQ